MARCGQHCHGGACRRSPTRSRVLSLLETHGGLGSAQLQGKVLWEPGGIRMDSEASCPQPLHICPAEPPLPPEPGSTGPICRWDTEAQGLGNPPAVPGEEGWLQVTWPPRPDSGVVGANSPAAALRAARALGGEG